MVDCAPVADTLTTSEGAGSSRYRLGFLRGFATASSGLWQVCALLLFVLLVIAGPLPLQSAESELELTVKAEFVDRFVRFVEWPPAPPGDGSFVMCVVGSSPVTPYLKQVASRRDVNGRRAKVVEVNDVSRVDQCQVVFLDGAASSRLAQVLERTAARPILTVGDVAGFGEQGVLINLYREGEYLRFEINLKAVERSGLTISSELLRLARRIDTK